jgi:CheY-like chemotaxis protein
MDGIMSELNRILVVDDSEIGNFLVKLTIEVSKINCESVFIKDAQEALDYFEQKNDLPDLIFLDINMPGLDGWDFLEEYKKKGFDKEFPDIKIFMLSTSMYSQDKERSNTFQFVQDYLEKPLKAEKLLEIKAEFFKE